jgi:hypothetical protein
VRDGRWEGDSSTQDGGGEVLLLIEGSLTPEAKREPFLSRRPSHAAALLIRTGEVGKAVPVAGCSAAHPQCRSHSGRERSARSGRLADDGGDAH